MRVHLADSFLVANISLLSFVRQMLESVFKSQKTHASFAESRNIDHNSHTTDEIVFVNVTQPIVQINLSEISQSANPEIPSGEPAAAGWDLRLRDSP